MNESERELIIKSVERFINWLDRNGYTSYDVYDFWSCKLGIDAKILFNKNKYLATPLVGMIQLFDSFFPHARYLFSKKKRFPLADAQLATGFLNYYRVTKNGIYLKKAQDLLGNLQKTATKTTNGIGWGNPYRWVTLMFEYKPNAPLITVTPYCFFAFYDAYKITENSKYLEILEQISNFVAYDMKETEFRDGTMGSSYGIDDNSLVYNAIAYRSTVLLKAGLLFKNKNFLSKSKKNIDYVIKYQNSDGSWYYSADSRFIDNFHTCFVLKNIAQAYNNFNEQYMLYSLNKGFYFYKNNFVRPNGSLRHFYKGKYPKFRKVEFYDYAEAIKLGVYLRDVIPEALWLSKNLSIELINNYQSSEGYYYTRINGLNGKNAIPYLRWPQAQLFNALTLFLLNIDEK